jgi:SNF2 family DNA or RNA helicase
MSSPIVLDESSAAEDVSMIDNDRHNNNDDNNNVNKAAAEVSWKFRKRPNSTEDESPVRKFIDGPEIDFSPGPRKFHRLRKASEIEENQENNQRRSGNERRNNAMSKSKIVVDEEEEEEEEIPEEEEEEEASSENYSEDSDYSGAKKKPKAAQSKAKAKSKPLVRTKKSPSPDLLQFDSEEEPFFDDSVEIKTSKSQPNNQRINSFFAKYQYDPQQQAKEYQNQTKSRRNQPNSDEDLHFEGSREDHNNNHFEENGQNGVRRSNRATKVKKSLKEEENLEESAEELPSKARNSRPANTFQPKKAVNQPNSKKTTKSKHSHDSENEYSSGGSVSSHESDYLSGESASESTGEGEVTSFEDTVESILGRRLRASSSRQEYLIKFKHRSFRHCVWIEAKEFLSRGKAVKAKISRWQKKEAEYNSFIPKHSAKIGNSQHSQHLSASQEDLEEVIRLDDAAHNHDHSAPVPTIKSTAYIQQKISEINDCSDVLEMFGCGLAGEFFPSDNLAVERIISQQEREIDEDELEDWLRRRDFMQKLHDERGMDEKWDNSKVGTNGRPVLHEYLVKWRGLGYDSCTYEYDIDIDEDLLIAKFHQFDELPSREQVKIANNYDKLRFNFTDPYNAKTIPPFNAGFELRSYQIEGLNWMIANWQMNRGCLLADEMGLGKTVQIVSFIRYLVEVHSIRGPFLIVAPLSTLGHWKREFETWTNLNAVVYHGSADAREIIRDHEFHEFGGEEHSDIYKFHALVTTPEICLTDADVLNRIAFKVMVCDEAHRLKSFTSKISQTLREFHYNHAILLTGTPIQNKIEELFTLLSFVDAEKFNDIDYYLEEYSGTATKEQVDRLHKLIKPYLLRRTKDQADKDLPAKHETIVDIEMTLVQKQWYRAIYEKNAEQLERLAETSGINKREKTESVNLTNISMELRKVCQHPFLIKGGEEAILGERNIRLDDYDKVQPVMIEVSAKLGFLDKFLPKMKSQGHKVLIFSQFVIMLNIIEEFLRYRGFLAARIDGSITGNARQSAIDHFSRPDSNLFVMMLSTKAGGVGINLTAADTVIIFDSDWNPQNDIQAQARAHRIGQTRPVIIYRLVVKDSYEAVMFAKSSQKLGLDKAILQSMTDNPDDTKKAPDRAQLEMWLKQGAYAVMDADKKPPVDFANMDIDEYLATHSRTIEQSKNTEASSFAYATFVAADNDTQLDLNDPLFWQKAGIFNKAKKTATEQKRIRQQAKILNVGHSDGEFDDSEGSEVEANEALIADNAQCGDSKFKPEVRDELVTLINQIGLGRFDKARKVLKLDGEIFSNFQLALFEYGYIARLVAHSDFKATHLLQLIKPALISTIKKALELNIIEKISNIAAAKSSKSSDIKGKEKKASETKPASALSSTPTKNQAISLDEDEDVEKPQANQQISPNKSAAIDDFDESSGDLNLELLSANDLLALIPLDKALGTERFKQRVERGAKPKLHELERLELLKQVIKVEAEGDNRAESGAGDFPELHINHYSVDLPDSVLDEAKADKNLPSWWTEQCDRSLLLGIYYFGLKNSEEIRSNPHLIFNAMDIQPAKRRQAGRTRSAKRSEDVIDQEVSSDDRCWPSANIISARFHRLISAVIVQLKKVEKEREKRLGEESRAKKKEEKDKVKLEREAKKAEKDKLKAEGKEPKKPKKKEIAYNPEKSKDLMEAVSNENTAAAAAGAKKSSSKQATLSFFGKPQPSVAPATSNSAPDAAELRANSSAGLAKPVASSYLGDFIDESGAVSGSDDEFIKPSSPHKRKSAETKPSAKLSSPNKKPRGSNSTNTSTPKKTKASPKKHKSPHSSSNKHKSQRKELSSGSNSKISKKSVAMEVETISSDDDLVPIPAPQKNSATNSNNSAAKSGNSAAKGKSSAAKPVQGSKSITSFFKSTPSQDPALLLQGAFSSKPKPEPGKLNFFLNDQ